MTFAEWCEANSHDLTSLTPEQVTTLQGEWREWLRSQGAPDTVSESAVPLGPIHYVGGPDGQPPLMC